MTALAVVASPALAAPAADSQPRVEGPLLQQGEPTCDGRRVISRGTVAADLHACLWWFAYAPVLETDAQRDHGVLWFQSSVTPRKGWCVKRVAGSLYSSPDVTRMHSYVVGGQRSGAPTLEVDAEGAALQGATISQTWDRFSGRVVVHPDVEGGSVAYTWKGRTRGPVDSIVGAEISWETASSALDVFEFGRLLNPVLTRCS